MNEFINEWKEPHVAQQQLERNIFELSSFRRYPRHWNHFINSVRELEEKVVRVVDVGCGVGSYCELCRKHFPNLQYLGYDYSPPAVELAKEKWGGDFICCNYQDLEPQHFNQTDILVANALCDVLPDGNNCLEHLLSLELSHLIIQRMKTTNRPSFFNIYEAYGISTYEFYHNREEALSLMDKYGYNYRINNMSNFLLSKK